MQLQRAMAAEAEAAREARAKVRNKHAWDFYESKELTKEDKTHTVGKS